MCCRFRKTFCVHERKVQWSSPVTPFGMPGQCSPVASTCASSEFDMRQYFTFPLKGRTLAQGMFCNPAVTSSTGLVGNTRGKASEARRTALFQKSSLIGTLGIPFDHVSVPPLSLRGLFQIHLETAFANFLAKRSSPDEPA